MDNTSYFVLTPQYSGPVLILLCVTIYSTGADTGGFWGFKHPLDFRFFFFLMFSFFFLNYFDILHGLFTLNPTLISHPMESGE